MGEIKDAIETMHDIKAEFASAAVYNTKRSISSASLEGTANFPVLVEDSISLDDGILVSRALEKKYASFLLTVLTMEPYLKIEKGQTPTAAAYLKQFHQNMNMKDSTRIKNNFGRTHIGLLGFLESTYNDCDMDYTIMECEAFKMASAIYEGVRSSVPQNKNIALNYTIEEVTNPESLNSKFYMGVPLTEAGHSDRPDQHRSFDHARDIKGNDIETLFINQAEHVNAKKDTNVVVQHADSYKAGDINVNPNIKLINPDGSDVKRPPRERSQWKPLTDNDCKKANDLVPTLLHVRVFPVDKYTNEEMTPIDFLMGVKATLHPIPVAELARMVVCGMRNENFVFNLIRWTTGEIKFFKDFLFAVDTLKMDAKDTGKEVTGWRPALKRRRNVAKSKIRVGKNGVMPNATLIVSQGATEYIKENYGYDLEDERIINRMMNVYFLLGYVSVNTVNQRASFRFDGIDSVDTYTFDTLKRENQNDDKAFKNMMKMLGRSM